MNSFLEKIPVIPAWIIAFSILALTVLITVSIYLERPFTVAGWNFGATEPPTRIPLLTGMIVMTDQECATLGEDWKPYNASGGRFPAGAGQGTDINGVTKAFHIGKPDSKPDGEGEYVHRLTEPEMPKHSHPFERHELSSEPKRCGGGCPRSMSSGKKEAFKSKTAGGNKAHNNIPPYFVVQFCKKEVARRSG